MEVGEVPKGIRWSAEAWGPPKVRIGRVRGWGPTVYEDDEDYAYKEPNDESDEDVDDESNGDLDIQADGHVSSFQTFNQVLENEKRIYVFAHAASCDVSNNPNVEEPNESSPVHYPLPPTPQFEYAENFGNAISSGWTPWVQHTTGYSSGEFVVGQVFNSKSDLQ